MTRKVFPDYHAIVSKELSSYFSAKAKAIEADGEVRRAGARLKLLGVDPEWRIQDALSASADEVFVCAHDGCDRPVISRSWDQREFCESHTPPPEKARPVDKLTPAEPEEDT